MGRIQSANDFPVPVQKALNGARAASGVARAQASRAAFIGPGLRDKVRDQHKNRRADTPAPAAGTPIKEIKFTLGATGRPNIVHDHGFLDDGTGKIDNSKRRAPTVMDRLLLAKWIAMLEGAETFKPELTDGTTAYRHFLFGNGTSRAFNYERFVENDSSGMRVLNSAIEDTMTAALRFSMQRMPFTPAKEMRDVFRFQSELIVVGGSDLRYPYPATENWQKAIGGHPIWLEGNATVIINPVAKSRSIEVQMTLRMEDMYNFNPDNADIATGTPDAENGRFEVTGLGHEFLQTAVLTRSLHLRVNIDFRGDVRTAAGNTSISRSGRTDRPRDNRRW
jgi:hypothetical protein